MSGRETLEELISSLKQQRDELALRMHLGATEARDEFKKVTSRLDELTESYAPLKNAVKDSTADVVESLRLVGEEVRNSFDRIRNSLKD